MHVLACTLHHKCTVQHYLHVQYMYPTHPYMYTTYVLYVQHTHVCTSICTYVLYNSMDISSPRAFCYTCKASPIWVIFIQVTWLLGGEVTGWKAERWSVNALSLWSTSSSWVLRLSNVSSFCSGAPKSRCMSFRMFWIEAFTSCREEGEGRRGGMTIHMPYQFFETGFCLEFHSEP